MKALEDWFDEEDFKTLESHGFKLVTYEGKITWQGDEQCMFIKSEAKKIRERKFSEIKRTVKAHKVVLPPFPEDEYGDPY
jgi:hypothetical protein